MVAFGRGERANDRQVLHLLGDARHMLADLNAGDVRLHRLEIAGVFRFGLEVPNVDRRGTAAHPKDDQAFVLLLERRTGGFERLNETHPRNGKRRHSGDVLEEMPPCGLFRSPHWPNPRDLSPNGADTCATSDFESTSKSLGGSVATSHGKDSELVAIHLPNLTLACVIKFLSRRKIGRRADRIVGRMLYHRSPIGTMGRKNPLFGLHHDE